MGPLPHDIGGASMGCLLRAEVGWRMQGCWSLVEKALVIGKGCALVGGKGWALVIRKGWALVIRKGWASSGKAGRDVGVTAVEEELITLQVLNSLYTAPLSTPVPPSHWDLGEPSITATDLVV